MRVACHPKRANAAPLPRLAGSHPIAIHGWALHTRDHRLEWGFTRRRRANWLATINLSRFQYAGKHSHRLVDAQPGWTSELLQLILPFAEAIVLDHRNTQPDSSRTVS